MAVVSPQNDAAFEKPASLDNPTRVFALGIPQDLI